MIPRHVKEFLKNRRVKVKGVGVGNVSDAHEEATVTSAPDEASSETLEMPDFAAMSYAELRKMIPNEEEASLPNKKKATLVAYLEEKWRAKHAGS